MTPIETLPLRPRDLPDPELLVLPGPLRGAELPAGYSGTSRSVRLVRAAPLRVEERLAAVLDAEYRGAPVAWMARHFLSRVLLSPVVTAEEAAAWRAAVGDPATAAAWCFFGFAPEEALSWRRAGVVTAHAAYDHRRSGASPYAYGLAADHVSGLRLAYGRHDSLVRVHDHEAVREHLPELADPSTTSIENEGSVREFLRAGWTPRESVLLPRHGVSEADALSHWRTHVRGRSGAPSLLDTLESGATPSRALHP